MPAPPAEATGVLERSPTGVAVRTNRGYTVYGTSFRTTKSTAGSLARIMQQNRRPKRKDMMRTWHRLRGRGAGRDGGKAMRPRVQSRCFTLTELMVVLLIMAILLAVAIPAFEKLTTGTGVDAAGRMVSAQLRLARQYAITQRAKIAIIMPGPAATGLTEKYRYSCLRAAIVTGGSSPFTFSEWVQNTTWSFIPIGASIMEADDDKGIKNAGSLSKTPNDDGYTKCSSVDMTKLVAGYTGTNIRCMVFAPTGRVLGASRYATIGDATFTGGSWAIRNPVESGEPLYDKNRSCANQVTIEVDTYTGRAVMETPDEY